MVPPEPFFPSRARASAQCGPCLYFALYELTRGVLSEDGAVSDEHFFPLRACAC